MVFFAFLLPAFTAPFGATNYLVLAGTSTGNSCWILRRIYPGLRVDCSSTTGFVASNP